jgi:antitoxin HicB
MLRYRVKLSKDTNGTILVDVPAIPEVHTFGEDRQEALVRAVDAIESAIGGYIEDRREIPRSDAGVRGASVAIPPLSEAKIALYEAMRAQRVSKAELARRLNCHMPQVDRLLNLTHSSRFDQLEAALRVVGKELSIQVDDLTKGAAA